MVAVAVVVVGMASGCSGTRRSAHTRTAPPPTTASASTTSTQPTCRAVNSTTCAPAPPKITTELPITQLPDASGSISVRSVDTALPDGQSFSANTITPDGRYLVGGLYKVLPGTPDAGGVAVAMLDIASHKVTRLRAFPSTKYQVTAMAVDDRWVVWTQDPDAQLENLDWEMLAYDRINGEVHLVTKAVTVGGRPLPTLGVSPSFAGEYVVWSAATADAPVGSHVATFAAPVSGGAPRLLAQDAENARGEGTGDNVAFDSFHVVGTRAVIDSVKLQNLTTGVTTTVARSGAATYLAYGPAGVIWVTADPAGSSVWSASPTGQDPKRVMQGGAPQFPAGGDQVLAWDQYGDGLFAYRPGTSSLIELTRTHGYVAASGHWLLWTTEGSTVVRVATTAP